MACHLVELVVEERLPGLRGAFQRAGCPLSHLVGPWMACCFRGVVPAAAAAQYVALGLALGPNWQVMTFTAGPAICLLIPGLDVPALVKSVT